MKTLPTFITALLIATSVALAGDPAGALLDARLAFASAKQRYSDKHPEFIKAKENLESLSKKKVPSKEYSAHVQQKLEKRQAEEAILAHRYLPKHPARIQITAEIAALKEELKTAEKEAAANP